MEQPLLFDLPDSVPQRHYVFVLSEEQIQQRLRDRFERLTAIVPEVFVDAVLFRAGFKGTVTERENLERELAAHLLERFGRDESFQMAVTVEAMDARALCEEAILTHLRRIGRHHLAT